MTTGEHVQGVRRTLMLEALCTYDRQKQKLITLNLLLSYPSAAFQAPVLDAKYEQKVKALSQMLTKTKAELDEVKNLADELKGVKLASPSGSVAVPDEEAMKEALAAARAVTDEFGIESIQARQAWETVEEVGESYKATIRAPLDEECLIELIEGCEALEKFNAALQSR